MSSWALRVPISGLILVLATASAGATPPTQAGAAVGGVLVAQDQEEPGGFRLEPPPPKPIPDPPPPAPATEPEAEAFRPRPEVEVSPRRDPTPGYVVLAVGGAFAIAGTVFAARTASSISDFPSLGRGQVLNDAFKTQLEEAQAAMLVNGLATSVLFSACISSLIAGTMYLVAD